MILIGTLNLFLFCHVISGYSGDRHGVKPLDRVDIRLGGPPSQGAALLTAARLGLELENDVRVASERLKTLKVPVVGVSRPLPNIQDPVPLSQPSSSSSSDADSDEIIRTMPLL